VEVSRRHAVLVAAMVLVLSAFAAVAATDGTSDAVEVPTLAAFQQLHSNVDALERRVETLEGRNGNGNGGRPPADEPDDPEDPAEPDDPDGPGGPQLDYDSNGVALATFDVQTEGDTLTVEYTLGTAQPVTFGEVAVAVRDAAGTNRDFGHVYSVTVDGSETVDAATDLGPGEYRVWIAYFTGGSWYDLPGEVTVTIDGDGAAEPPAPDEPENGDTQAAPPVGGSWALAFEDTFDGDAVNEDLWTHRSSSQSHRMQGNKPNGQLSLNQLENCEVADGVLHQHAKRERVNFHGQRYDWTSCLLTTRAEFEAGDGLYIEERSTQPPAASGMWPAFWTWQAPGINSQQEIDVYEYWPSWAGRAGYWSNGTHGAMGSSFAWHRFADYDADPEAFNRYGAHITRDGVTFYLNGQEVNRNPRTIGARVNLITNMFVWADVPPPADSQGETRQVDYVRAWTRD